VKKHQGTVRDALEDIEKIEARWDGPRIFSQLPVADLQDAASEWLAALP
jgi:hypothetical protein